MKRIEVRVENYLTEAHRVAAYPAYQDSIVLNLITNALKYRSPERALHISAECRDRGNNQLEFVFSDNGSGIDLEKHGKELFGMYKTFHHHPESSGLGLYLTKMQVEAMGGSIRVVSKVNEGTTFIVSLNKWKNG